MGSLYSFQKTGKCNIFKEGVRINQYSRKRKKKPLTYIFQTERDYVKEIGFQLRKGWRCIKGGRCWRPETRA